MEESKSFLEKLPDNVKRLVLHYCSENFKDVQSLRQTCRTFKNIIDATHEVWTGPISALHLAARYDNVDMAVNCIYRGFQLEQKILTRIGFPMQLLYHGTALHVAAYYSSNEVLRVLLEAGADKDAESTFYGSVIQMTIEVGNEDGFSLLMAAKAELKGALTTCARVGNTQAARRILNEYEMDGDELNSSHRESPLFVACQNGFYYLAKVLMEKGAPPVTAGPTSIFGTRETPLTAACENGHVSIANLLMEAGASPDPPAPTYAIAARNPAEMTWRLKNSSPLFLAFRKEDLEMFHLLLKRGATFNLAPYAPQFHQGMLHGILNEMSFFTKPHKGVGMIWLALQAGGFDINARDPEGDTALHTLAKILCDRRYQHSYYYHFNNVLDMLLQHGADKTLKNAQGKTPFDILFSSGGPYAKGASEGELLKYSLNITGLIDFLKVVYPKLL